MSIDSADFRRVMGRFATGVTVATAALPDGRRVGLTVNSFVSVSLTPPLVLFCLHETSVAQDVFGQATHYAINILAQDQEAVSRAFAQRGQGAERWQSCTSRLGISGAPLLEGALATIECKITQRISAGDHTILLGEVVHLQAHEGTPLLYWSSSYRKFVG